MANKKKTSATLVAKFPFVKIMQTKDRFVGYFSLSKKEIRMFDRAVVFNREDWREAMFAALDSESEEELKKRIDKIVKNAWPLN